MTIAQQKTELIEYLFSIHTKKPKTKKHENINTNNTRINNT